MRTRTPDADPNEPKAIYGQVNDRDAALAKSYALSEVMQNCLGRSHADQIVPDVIAAMPLLVDLYLAEAVDMPAVGLEQRQERWSNKHFGRDLEPALRAILRFEILRALEPHGRRGVARPGFRDWAEQSRWERAAAVIEADPSDSERRCRLIAEACGASIGSGPQSMPEASQG